jgi:hypothetical protein
MRIGQGELRVFIVLFMMIGNVGGIGVDIGGGVNMEDLKEMEACSEGDLDKEKIIHTVGPRVVGGVMKGHPIEGQHQSGKTYHVEIV